MGAAAQRFGKRVGCVFDSASYFVDGSKDPTRFLPTWELLYDCWLKALSLFDPPIEPVSILYENTELHGFFIRGTSTSRKRPLLILVAYEKRIAAAIADPGVVDVSTSWTANFPKPMLEIIDEASGNRA